MKIEAIPFNIVLSLVNSQMVSACRTCGVTVKSVGCAEDYIDSMEDNEFPLLAIVNIENADNDGDCGEHPWLLVWDEDTCDFHTIMRLDQEPYSKTEDNE